MILLYECMPLITSETAAPIWMFFYCKQRYTKTKLRWIDHALDGIDTPTSPAVWSSADQLLFIYYHAWEYLIGRIIKVVEKMDMLFVHVFCIYYKSICNEHAII